MKEIAIESKVHGRHSVLLDDEDHEEITKFKWSLKIGQNTSYVYRKQGKNEQSPKSNVLFHRLIMKNY